MVGNAVPHEVRRHVIRRAAEVRGYEDWAEEVRRHQHVELWDFEAHRRYLALNTEDPIRYDFDDRSAFEAVPFTYEEIADALSAFAKSSEGEAFLYSERTPYDSDEPEGIVPYCKWVATKHGYAEYYFVRFKDRVSGLYKELFPYLMGRRLPLVIADEAHHWRRKTQGCLSFCKFIAPFTHRLLMLTATPFQLHRDELSGIFSVGDCMEKTIGKDRVEEVKRRLNEVLKAMGKSEDAGRKFSMLWGRLADDLRTIDTEAKLAGLSASEERTKFERQVEEYWRNLKADGSGNSEVVLSNIPGRVRPFFDAAIKLKHANQQLGAVMRKLVVRHRREIAHRRYRVGHGYPPRSAESERPDQHQLHAARGSQLPSETELAQFLLMKVVASATRGKTKDCSRHGCDRRIFDTLA